MTATITGSILILFIIVIYILFALGYPVGEYIMGGQNKVMPKGKNRLILVAIILQIVMMATLLQGGKVINLGILDIVTRILCWIFAIYVSLNVIMNLFSRSKKEKMVMTPLSFITAVCYWLVIIDL